jgi:hypothetical protein
MGPGGGVDNFVPVSYQLYPGKKITVEWYTVHTKKEMDTQEVSEHSLSLLCIPVHKWI